MSTVAIVGAGPIGAAVAERLAERGRVSEIRLVDAAANVAAGKALDIRQAGPVGRFDTKLSSAAEILAAAGATVIVVADSVEDGEWQGERGMAMIAQIARAGSNAPIVFAGPTQTSLMEAAYRDAKIARHRLVGSAPTALVSAVRAFAGVEMNLASVELTITGRPPALVIGWSAASAAGCLVTDRVPAHRLLAISSSIKKLWPPGPQAIGAATARVVEALIDGSRSLHPALTILDAELGVRGAAVVLPLELGRLRVLSHVMPSLSPQEKTEMLNGLLH